MSTSPTRRRDRDDSAPQEPMTWAHENKEVPPMMLADLIDRTRIVADGGDALPCQAHDPELWFAERPEDVERAKAMCRQCPLQQMCLAGAKDRNEPWGVWGGELFAQGVVIPRKRPRGRPRKVRVAA